jgi:2-iminobutanoate/2-iminopropanoate deaminase
MRKTSLAPEDVTPNPCLPANRAQGWRVDGAQNIVFVGGQISGGPTGDVIAPGDIETQTRNVMDNIGLVLRDANASWTDVVRLDAFYVFDGPEDDLPDFWKKISSVCDEFLPKPGPVWTGIRVPGLAYPGLLIEIDAVAVAADSDGEREG